MTAWSTILNLKSRLENAEKSSSEIKWKILNLVKSKKFEKEIEAKLMEIV